VVERHGRVRLRGLGDHDRAIPDDAALDLDLALGPQFDPARAIGVEGVALVVKAGTSQGLDGLVGGDRRYVRVLRLNLD
jgi:hypothetical protein